jgi:hypothetical protein
MTAPIRHSELRSRRTPATLLLISERNKLLLEAAKFYPGASDRGIARQLRIALLRYREGRFRRTQSRGRVRPNTSDASTSCFG